MISLRFAFAQSKITTLFTHLAMNFIVHTACEAGQSLLERTGCLRSLSAYRVPRADLRAPNFMDPLPPNCLKLEQTLYSCLYKVCLGRLVLKLEPQRPLAAARAACRPRPRGGRNEEIVSGILSPPRSEAGRHGRMSPRTPGSGTHTEPGMRPDDTMHRTTLRPSPLDVGTDRVAAVTGIGNPPSRIVAIAGRARPLTSMDLCPGMA